MRKVVASQWYQVNKQNAQLLAINRLQVARAAYAFFNRPVEVIKTGRFQTPFAIYSRGELLTDSEKSE